MKAVVSAWIGSNNLGDELIYKALLAQLESIGIGRPDVTAVTVDVEGTQAKFSTQAVGSFDLLGQIRAIFQADLLVFGGGGLLQDETSIWNLPYHLSRVWLARFLDTPVVAVGLGVGRITTRFGALLVRLSFPRKIPIIVRDEESKQVLDAIGVKHAVQEADLVLSFPPVAASPKGYIAVALRPFSQKGGVVPVGMRKSQKDPKDPRQIAAVLDKASAETDLPIRFVSYDLDKDRAYQKSIAAHMSSEVSFVTPTVDNVTEVIGSADVVIGMRYHAGIVAFVSGVPSVMIGYSPKVLSLAKEAGEGCKVLANTIEAFESIPTLVKEVLGQGDSVVKARDRLRVRAINNVAPIRKLVEDR